MTKQEICDRFYPIGAGYITTSNINPKDTIGGQWELAKGNLFIDINTGDLVINDGDNYNSSSTSSYVSDSMTHSAQNPRHTHTVPTLYNGVYSDKNLSVHPINGDCKDYNFSYDDDNFYSGLYGASHTHYMTHLHSYDLSYIKVYLWKRIG